MCAVKGYEAVADVHDVRRSRWLRLRSARVVWFVAGAAAVSAYQLAVRGGTAGVSAPALASAPAVSRDELYCASKSPVAAAFCAQDLARARADITALMSEARQRCSRGNGSSILGPSAQWSQFAHSLRVKIWSSYSPFMPQRDSKLESRNGYALAFPDAEISITDYLHELPAEEKARGHVACAQCAHSTARTRRERERSGLVLGSDRVRRRRRSFRASRCGGRAQPS